MKNDVFQALADPTRRAILSRLATEAMTPTAMSDHFDMSRQAVSKHMQVLAGCRLVKFRQTGREIHYSLNPRPMKAVADWLDPFRKLWDARFDQLDALLNPKK